MPYVRRAIIVAAGKGERMMPLTKDTPKPLIAVNGTPMIESVIGALHANNIEDIIIVTGYCKEQFRYLVEKNRNRCLSGEHSDIHLSGEHGGIRLVENPHYATCNNIASLYVARDFLDRDVMILDGDQIVNDVAALSPSFERSCYNAVRISKETNEWLLTVEDGIVTHCARNGGREGFQLYSVSRWTKDDAAQMKHHLEIEFEQNKHTDLFWDDVPLFCYPDAYRIGIHEMQKGDILEIDSPEELLEAEETLRLM